MVYLKKGRTARKGTIRKVFQRRRGTMTEFVQPTAEILMSNPRSNELRSISLKLVEKLIDRAKGNDDPQLDTNIATLSQQLSAMDITPNMHVGLSQEAFSDPVTMTEYVAGQLFANTNTRDLIIMHSIRNVTLRFLDAEPV
jgi:hypothetical protein